MMSLTRRDIIDGVTNLLSPLLPPKKGPDADSVEIFAPVSAPRMSPVPSQSFPLPPSIPQYPPVMFLQCPHRLPCPRLSQGRACAFAQSFWPLPLSGVSTGIYWDILGGAGRALGWAGGPLGCIKMDLEDTGTDLGGYWDVLGGYWDIVGGTGTYWFILVCTGTHAFLPHPRTPLPPSGSWCPSWWCGGAGAP